MIEKLDKDCGKLQHKINELVDVVKEQQQQLNNHMCRLVVLESDNKNIKDVFDQLHPELKIVRTLTQIEPADPYTEQKKWIGKLCKFWDDSDEPENCVYDVLCNIFDLHHEDCPFQCGNGEWYEYCEPVKPDDDIIYKEGGNEK